MLEHTKSLGELEFSKVKVELGDFLALDVGYFPIPHFVPNVLHDIGLVQDWSIINRPYLPDLIKKVSLRKYAFEVKTEYKKIATVRIQVYCLEPQVRGGKTYICNNIYINPPLVFCFYARGGGSYRCICCYTIPPRTCVLNSKLLDYFLFRTFYFPVEEAAVALVTV